MAGFLKKAQVYLGLGPDDEYEDYDEADERPAPPGRDARDPRDHGVTPVRQTTSSVRATASSTTERRVTTSSTSRPAGTRPAAAARTTRESATRPRPSAAEALAAELANEGSVVRTLPPKERPVESASSATKSKSAVRAVSATAKPVVLSPTTFNSAQEVADKFKANQPVILNLQGIDRELSRRLLDFCSGICYALSGHMEKVATRVYLLTPANVEVSADERRRLTERGLAG
jgi:cell division inhibitor SepF